MKYTLLFFLVLQLAWTGPVHGLSDHHDHAHMHATDSLDQAEHDTDHAHVHLSNSVLHSPNYIYGPITKSMLLDSPEKNLIRRHYSPPVPPPIFS